MQVCLLYFPGSFWFRFEQLPQTQLFGLFFTIIQCPLGLPLFSFFPFERFPFRRFSRGPSLSFHPATVRPTFSNGEQRRADFAFFFRRGRLMAGLRPDGFCSFLVRALAALGPTFGRRKPSPAVCMLACLSSPGERRGMGRWTLWVLALIYLPVLAPLRWTVRMLSPGLFSLDLFFRIDDRGSPFVLASLTRIQAS